MFLQNLMLALTAQGLGSCPQHSVAGYADALGHPTAGRSLDCLRFVYRPSDPAAVVNTFVPERLPLVDLLIGSSS